MACNIPFCVDGLSVYPDPGIRIIFLVEHTVRTLYVVSDHALSAHSRAINTLAVCLSRVSIYRKMVLIY